MDPLPTTKYQQRPYRFNRKRRRSGTEGLDAEGKIFFKIILIQNCQLDFNHVF